MKYKISSTNAYSDTMLKRYIEGSYKEIVIPEDITIIREYAFYNSPSRNITFHNKLQRIERSAFYGSKINTLEIPACEIVEEAFNQCFELKTVIIKDIDPTGLTFMSQIGKRAFLNCSFLTNVTISKFIRYIDQEAFAGCSNLQKINYTGTIAEWNNIIKGKDWYEVSYLKEIICSDGTINLEV